MARFVLALSLTIALLALAPPVRAQAPEEKDKLTLNFRLILQTRVSTIPEARDAEGNAYDPLRGTTGDPDPARFDLRPIRIGTSLQYGDHWRSFIIFRSERLDLNNPAVFNRLVHLYIGNVEYLFQTGSVEHLIHFGLDKPWNNESSIPAFSNLFPTDRLVAVRIEVRGSGVGYILRSPLFNVGLDVQANNTLVKDKQSGDLVGRDETNGLFYSGRIELTPRRDWMLSRKVESYAGAEGTGMLLGFDAQFNHKNLDDDGSEDTFTQSDTLTFGPDLLVHWDGLSAIAELRWRRTSIDVVSDAGGENDFVRKWILWDLQAGYAIPLKWFDIPAGKTIVEPALGFAYQDSDTDVRSTPVYGSGDNGPDGTTINAGANIYFAGHNSKLQLAYQRWRAEAGKAQSNIIRAQYQLSF